RLGCSASSCLPCMYLDSFPTRRSSDLRKILYRILEKFKSLLRRHQTVGGALVRQGRQPVGDQIDIVRWRRHLSGGLEHIGEVGRSEEHTSELQSRENLVCRLLLEKKKN